MPISERSAQFLNTDGTVPALQVLNTPATAKGLPAVAVDQEDSTGAGVLVRAAGTLMDLQSTSGVSQFKVTSTGLVSSGGYATSFPSEPAGTNARILDSHLISSGSLAAYSTAGQVAVNSIGLPAGLVVSNIQVLIGATGVNGPTHFWLALLDSSLHVLAVSTDQTNGAQAANTPIKLAVTTDGSHPYTVASTGLYYVAASSSASTTAPTAAGATVIAAAGGLTPIPCGTAGTQAAPPAVGAQLASGTVTFATAGDFAAWLS